MHLIKITQNVNASHYLTTIRNSVKVMSPETDSERDRTSEREREKQIENEQDQKKLDQNLYKLILDATNFIRSSNSCIRKSIVKEKKKKNFSEMYLCT